MWPFKREKKYWVVIAFHSEKSSYLDETLDATSDIELAMVFSRILDVKRVVSAMRTAKMATTYVRVRVDQTGQVALELL